MSSQTEGVSPVGGSTMSQVWQIGPDLSKVATNLSRLCKQILVAPYAYSQYLAGEETKKRTAGIKEISINATTITVAEGEGKGRRFDWSWTKLDDTSWVDIAAGIVYPSVSFLYPLQGLLGLAFYGLDKISRKAQDIINDERLNNLTRIILVVAFAVNVRATILAPTPLSLAVLVPLVLEFRKLRLKPQHTTLEQETIDRMATALAPAVAQAIAQQGKKKRPTTDATS